MTAAGITVRLERTLSAPPHRVYRAWLDPEVVRRWLAPAGFETVYAEVDEHVGGRHRIWHAAPGGEPRGGAESTVEELVPDERIVLEWTFVGPDRTVEPVWATRLTITLSSQEDGGTRLTLVHDRLEGLAASAPGVAAGVGEGWTQALDKLVDAV